MNALAVIAGYVLGSIPVAFVLASRLAGVDLRSSGSGNVGATNVFRTTRPSLGIAAALLDVAKGAAAVWLAGELGGGASTRAAAGAAAVLGHVYPVWLRFHGGKGVAVAAGAFGVLAPAAAMAAAVLFGLLVAISRYVSLGSVAATVLLPSVVAVTEGPGPTLYAAVCSAALIVFRHRGNVRRLLIGTERRLGEAA